MAIADTVRKYVEAGREALSPKKAEDIARALAKQGEIRRDQVASLTRELVGWSRRNRDRLVDLIRAEVKRQMARTGVASREEVDALKRRVRELERSAKAPTPTRKTASSRSSTASSRTAKPSTSTAKRKATAGRKKPSAARRPPA